MSQNFIQPVSADEVANGINGDPDTLYRSTTAPWGLHRYIGSGLALQPVGVSRRIVGAAISGQTFYLFTLENLKQFGALKAIGVTDGQILRMVILQALVVGALGYGLGIGLCALFFYGTREVTALAGFVLHWEVMAGTAAAVFVIMVLSSIASIRKVFVLDPAVVFRG